MVRILTWNVNGIRALPAALGATLHSLDADIICFQETKITRDQLDLSVSLVDGFSAFYSYCRRRSGYSGVAIFCRAPLVPVAASDGLSCLNADAPDSVPFTAPEGLSAERVAELDNEGRAVLVQFGAACCGAPPGHRLTVICVYCPRGDPDLPERMAFKMDFHRLLQHRAERLALSGHVVIAGDLNISHRLLDHCDKEDPKSSYSGALHSEFIAKPARQWIDRLLTPSQRDPDVEKCSEQSGQAAGVGGMFADNFRVKHPDTEGAFTCWCSKTGARQTNFGNRIDYILSDVALTEAGLRSCDIHPEVQGSDHCPVSAEFALELTPGGPRPPSLCTRFLPEFQGRQQRISDFFQRRPPAPKPAAPKRSAGQAKLDAFVTKKAPAAKVVAEAVAVPEKRAAGGEGRSAAASAWSQLLTGPGKPPLCRGHNEPCVLRTVKKDSMNRGRQFWVCSHPEGAPSNPNSRCDHFVWVDKKKK